jgi:hypothetical protein
MEHSDVVRLALVLAIQAEIEGMKASNEYLKQSGSPQLYGNEKFQEKAEELRNLAYCNGHQL